MKPFRLLYLIPAWSIGIAVAYGWAWLNYKLWEIPYPHPWWFGVTDFILFCPLLSVGMGVFLFSAFIILTSFEDKT